MTLEPTNIIAGLNRKVWWLCAMGHEWQAVCSSRAHGQRGCPVCSGAVVLPGFNDLATTHPALAQGWHPRRNGARTPAHISAGATRRVWWLCERGHEWQATCDSRSGALATGCPYCSNKAVLAGYNDLATTHPTLAVEWHPTRNGTLTPKQVTAGTAKKVWWLCALGHEWPAISSNRARLGVGCPDCSATGFRPNEAAHVYIVTKGDGHKIGVMNVGSNRLAQHRTYGWLPAQTWRFTLGRDAYSVEQHVLRYVRNELGLLPHVTGSEMPQNGATETVSESDLTLEGLAALVDQAREALGLAGASSPEQVNDRLPNLEVG